MGASKSKSKARESAKAVDYGSDGGQDDHINDSLDDITDGPAYNNATNRRKSVFAEAYNPEEDEEDEKPTIHPKSDVQRKRLTEAVKGILLFRSLEPEQLGEVLDAMFQRDVTEGETIIEQGDDGDNFYIIEDGKYNTLVNSDLVFSYENEGSFGELALMYNMPRAATIKAVTPGILWAMDRSTFRRIVLRKAFQKRKMFETLLEAVPMLESLSSYDRMNLADALVSKSFSDGEVIVRQGDPADGMYIVEEGEVVISIAENGVEKTISTLEKGAFLGELALLTHNPRAATATAKGDVRVAFLDVLAFERLLGPCKRLMMGTREEYKNQKIQAFGYDIQVKDLR